MDRRRGVKRGNRRVSYKVCDENAKRRIIEAAERDGVTFCWSVRLVDPLIRTREKNVVIRSKPCWISLFVRSDQSKFKRFIFLYKIENYLNSNVSTHHS